MKGFNYLAALALALALIVAGCGGSDGGGGGGDSGSTAATASDASAGTTSTAGGGTEASGEGGDALTQSEFVEQANAICVEGRDKLSALQNDIRSDIQGTSPEDIRSAVQEVLKRSVPIIRDMFNQIAALDAPEDLQGKLDEFETKANEALDRFETDPDKAVSGAGANSSAFADLNQLARDLGLNDCGTRSG